MTAHSNGSTAPTDPGGVGLPERAQTSARGAGAAAVALVRAALDALDSAGVAHCLRNGGGALDWSPGEDVDVLVAPADRRRAGAVLTTAGWHLLRAPGHRGHDFWVRHTDEGAWVKLDVVTRLRYGSDVLDVVPVIARRVRADDGCWVAGAQDEQDHRARRLAGQREAATALERVRRRLPTSVLRRGPVVAVLGPDGAGKGTVTDELAHRLPVAVTTVYLGDRRASRAAAGEAGRESVQTDDGATTPATARTPSPAAPAQPSATREVAFLALKWLRLLRPLATAYSRAWRGHVVLCDRHPLDTLAVAPQRRAPGRALERALTLYLTPRPDAVVVLDAPGEVLWQRKHEHSPDTLERWREGYRRLPGADVVDTTGGVPEAVVSADLVLWRALARRRGWARR